MRGFWGGSGITDAVVPFAKEPKVDAVLMASRLLTNSVHSLSQIAAVLQEADWSAEEVLEVAEGLRAVIDAKLRVMVLLQTAAARKQKLVTDGARGVKGD